jgi:hypothetical protein
VNQPRQHHTVPATYLELYRAPGSGKAHVLDLVKGEFRFQKPDNILTRRDYYRQRHAPEGKDEFCFEKMMAAQFEPQLKRVINKIIRGGHDMSEDEFARFAVFLELQHLKGPVQADFAKELLRQQVESIAMSIPEVAEGITAKRYKVAIRDEWRFTFMFEMLKEQMHFWHFTRMLWNVWTMPTDFHLVTTDNPVTIFNPDYPHLAQPGIGRAGSVVLFPLTPMYCLELIHPERECDQGFDPAAVVECTPGDTSIHLRAGRTMPDRKAQAVNMVLATRADRFVISDNRLALEQVWTRINDLPTIKAKGSTSNRGRGESAGTGADQ